MTRKNIVALIVIFILLGVIGFILTNEFIPPINQYKTYVVSGKITVLDNIIGSRPQYVRVYYPYYMSKHLCRGRVIELSNIIWNDEKKGLFEISFSVPLGLSNVLLTTDCTSCYSESILLDEIPESVDLIWDGNNCNEAFLISDDSIEALRHARNFLNGIEERLVKKQFSSQEKENIKNDVEDGRGAISESELIDDYNESLLQAYYAEWFAWRAQYKLYLYDLKHCVKNVNDILVHHSDDACYVPDYNA